MINKMFEHLLELYKQGKITDKGLEKAVRKKLITEEQAEEIIAEAQAILNENKITEV